jgi:hypothetical protein
VSPDIVPDLPARYARRDLDPLRPTADFQRLLMNVAIPDDLFNR